MKTIIAGTRTIEDRMLVIEALFEALDAGIEVTEVVSGGARGVDRIGEHYAKVCGLPLHVYPANWTLLGKNAGFIRNEDMARNAEALIAVWDGKSRGTAHMITVAEKLGLKVYVKRVDHR